MIINQLNLVLIKFHNIFCLEHTKTPIDKTICQLGRCEARSTNEGEIIPVLKCMKEYDGKFIKITFKNF